jgi:hypothetical protein
MALQEVCKHLYYHLFACSFLCDLLHPIFLVISGDPYMFEKKMQYSVNKQAVAEQFGVEK